MSGYDAGASPRGTGMSRTGGLLRGLARGAIDFLYPPRCLGCDGDASSGSPHLCAACETALAAPPLLGAIGAHGRMPVRAAGWMSGALESLVHALKYHGMLAAAPILSRRLAAAMPASVRERGGVLLVPVPLDAARHRERRFNQAELLAAGVARELGLAAAPRWVRKHRPTGSQTRLGRDARRRNVHASMRAARSASFRGRRVWLVDDVATTGATLEELARAVRAAGGDVEGALVAARTADA